MLKTWNLLYLQIFVWLSGCLDVGIFADGHLQIFLEVFYYFLFTIFFYCVIVQKASRFIYLIEKIDL